MWPFKKRDPNRCRIAEEWCGIFIGRRHCTTHNNVWDDGRECPYWTNGYRHFFLGRVAGKERY